LYTYSCCTDQLTGIGGQAGLTLDLTALCCLYSIDQSSVLHIIPLVASGLDESGRALGQSGCFFSLHGKSPAAMASTPSTDGKKLRKVKQMSGLFDKSTK